MSELSAPLRTRRVRDAKRPRSRPTRHRLPVARLATAAIIVLLGAVGLRIVLVDTPQGGRPTAEVPLKAGNDGTRSSTGTASGISAIEVGPELPLSEVAPALGEPMAGAAPATGIYATSPDLLEETPYGAIPRISATGDTPFAAYSRPSVSAAAAGGRPRIAIVVTGLGINESGTLDAISRLPETVTLAFAPYGRTLERTVGSARADGHEIYLEVPLEPFDYPDNDPGPDTLLTGEQPRENMDRLHRVMSRFGGYAGIMNNMGARFTASAADFGPMMEELAARGLAYVDDGSSNRSLAHQLSRSNGVPFVRADMPLDTNPAREPILAQLEALETKARSEGAALGIATALPVSVQTIAEWTDGLEEKGILLVPASALMQP